MDASASSRLPLADLFQALADPTRLRILALLRSMELSVGELAQVLGQSQPRVSRHVKILADSGLVDRHKEGSWVFLALSPTRTAAALFDLIDAASDEPSRATLDGDRIRLNAVRAVRACDPYPFPTDPQLGDHSEIWNEIEFTFTPR